MTIQDAATALLNKAPADAAAAFRHMAGETAGLVALEIADRINASSSGSDQVWFDEFRKELTSQEADR